MIGRKQALVLFSAILLIAFEVHAQSPDVNSSSPIPSYVMCVQFENYGVQSKIINGLHEGQKLQLNFARISDDGKYYIYSGVAPNLANAGGGQNINLTYDVN